MAIIKCKMCGGDIELSADKTYGICEYCGNTMTLPKVDNDQRAAAFNRGNHFRRIGEFDKALAVYERIVAEDDSDAEAHWCCALCRYGIEYVEDPATYEWLPTCHRASFDNFLEDVDYLAALDNSDGITRRQYQKDAAKIAEVQRGILATSQNTEPYDVFISYKELDDNGNRTRDSILAQDIYYQLTEKGWRVFFSRISLEDVPGTQYEPYIFAALNSAKVMVAVGTSGENLNAVWVKNEWSRFLSLMRKDRSKLLLPCYRDMDPYDLPEQLSVLMSYDMGKIGFIQDLIRGIDKVLSADKPKEIEHETVKETVVVQQGGANVQALIDRGNMALEDGKWNDAETFFNRALDMNAKCAEAYLGMFLAQRESRDAESFVAELMSRYEHCEYDNFSCPVDSGRISQAIKNYLVPYYLDEGSIRKAMEFDTRFESCLNSRKKHLEDAKKFFANDSNFARAIKFASGESLQKIKSIEGDVLAELTKRVELAQAEDDANRAAKAAAYAEHLDKAEETLKQRYEQALAQRSSEKKPKKEKVENKASKEKTGKKKVFPIILGIAALVAVAAFFVLPLMRSENTTISAGYDHTVALKTNGTVVATGNLYKCHVGDWRNIVSVSAGRNHTVGLKANGKVVATGSEKSGQCDVSDWRNIIAVSAGTYHTVGLKANGEVVATGLNTSRQCFVSTWSDIVSVSAGYNHTVGLKADGTVVAAGENRTGQCDVSGWKDIVAISAGYNYTLGLKADGTVVAVGDHTYFPCDVGTWRDIVAISAGSRHAVGLKSDGTVVAVGDYNAGQCNVSAWKDIVAISAGHSHTVGLRADGTVVAVGNKLDGRRDVSAWTDIKVPESNKSSFAIMQKLPKLMAKEQGTEPVNGNNITQISAGGNHTVGLKADGTVAFAGHESNPSKSVEQWTDIVAIFSGDYHVVGLKADGTVVAVGSNLLNKCDVDTWTDIVAVSAGDSSTVGLKADGTVVAVGGNTYGQCEVSDWTGIGAVSAGGGHTLGLKSDGTVVAVGWNEYSQSDVSNWADIVAISAGSAHSVGLKSDGTVVAVGQDNFGQCEVSSWEDVISIGTGSWHTVGLKSDGTVVATGNNSSGQCEVSGWTDIVAISVGREYTLGLKSNGTVVAVGANGYGQCDVSDWKYIKLPEA